MKKSILILIIALFTTKSQAGYYLLYVRQPDPLVMPEENDAELYVDSYVNFYATVCDYQTPASIPGVGTYAAGAFVDNITSGQNLILLDGRFGEGSKSTSISDGGGAYYRLHVIAIGGQASISVDW